MRRAAGAVFLAGQALSVAAAAVFHARLVAPDRYDPLRSAQAGWWLLVAAVLCGASYGLGLPELPPSRRQAAGRSALAYGAAVGAVSLAQLGLAGPLLPRSSLLVLALTTPVWALICWNLSGDVTTWRQGRDRVFVVAAQADEAATLAGELAGDLGRWPEVPAVVAGTLTPEAARPAADGTPRLVDEVRRAGATVVVLDREAQADDTIVAQAAELHRAGLRVRTLALFYEGWLGKTPVPELAQVSLLFDIGELHRLSYMRAKRVLDLGLGLAGLPVLAAVAPLVWLGNRVANPGPLLFRQRRVGRDGAEFVMWKFRTMVPDGGDGGPSPWTRHGDPRVTPFGRFLRRTHLDELPQLVNVVRGELSLVGPRPEQPHYVAELQAKIPFYDVRHLVRPGLTGWAQVKQGYAADEADALEKLQYDVYYLRRQGLALDARIIWRTVRGVIGAGGR